MLRVVSYKLTDVSEVLTASVSFCKTIRRSIPEDILMMIMSMGCNYVSELQLPTGQLFIPQVIYEHGELWWNDIDSERHLIRPPELYGNPTSRVK
jgi:hypothetical protein